MAEMAKMARLRWTGSLAPAMALLRDLRTGRVRGILDGWPLGGEGGARDTGGGASAAGARFGGLVEHRHPVP